MDKSEMRAYFGRRRALVEGAVDKSRKIVNRLCSVTEGFKSVFCYVSFGNEVNTHQFIEEMLAFGRVIGVPHTENGVMRCRRLISFENLETDRRGNLLNASLGGEFLPDAAVIPMLCFNRERFRLGYGGGYYDKYLCDKDIFKIGVAFEEQFCDYFECERHDVRLDVILTDEGEY